MSEDLVNDQIMDNIVNDITDKLDAQDEKTWGIYTEVAIEHGYHMDDDYDKIVQIMIDKEFDKQSQ